MNAYIELQATSHFSFLRGVSSCEELFSAAALLGYKSLGIVDRNTVGGLVSALRAAETTGIRLVAGCRLDLTEPCPEPGRGGSPERNRGASLLVWPENRAGWSSLTRLLSLRRGQKKGSRRICTGSLKFGSVAPGYPPLSEFLLALVK